MPETPDQQQNADPNFVELPGSSRKAKSIASSGPAPADQILDVTVSLRGKSVVPTLRPGQGISRETYAAQYGASQSDILAVQTYASQCGLNIDKVDVARRGVWLSGTVAQFSKAFKVDLITYTVGGKTFRSRVGSISIPVSLKGIIVSIDGLTDEPLARAFYTYSKIKPHALAPFSQGLTPLQVATRYNFPTGVTGKGQTIGIIELGGGYDPAEIASYFNQIGLTLPPTVTDGQFHGQGANTPGSSADTEVVLDIEVAGAVAPGANIVVYFGPDASGQSFLDALSAAVHDAVNKPNIISISWGSPETNWTQQLQQQFDAILQAAAQMNVTVCVAAGDNGSADFAATDPNWDQTAHVDFPASDPYSLACGGTRLVGGTDPTQAEVVWNSGPNSGTGGGVSRVFPLPSYQNGAGVPQAANPVGPIMRGVPDVSGNAAPETGYSILCDKNWQVVGGTSAVAPLWAGLIALLNEKLGRSLGFLNPALYQLGSPSRSFNDIVTGNNGDYQSGLGWDACTGLGTPNGAQLSQALSGTVSSNVDRVGTRVSSTPQVITDPRLAVIAQYLSVTDKLLTALYAEAPSNANNLSPRSSQIPTNYQTIVAKIISILLDVGKPTPINEDTTIDDKADAILVPVNVAFFPPGKGFNGGDILSTETVSQLAFEVIQLQGA